MPVQEFHFLWIYNWFENETVSFEKLFYREKKDQNFKQLKFSIFHNAATFLPQMSLGYI